MAHGFRNRSVTHWALGHGCFRRSAGFRVGGWGMVRDRGTATAAEYNVDGAVTVLEAHVDGIGTLGRRTSVRRRRWSIGTVSAMASASACIGGQAGDPSRCTRHRRRLG